jgi:glucosylceramidase
VGLYSPIQPPSTTPPFDECPAIGVDQSCAFLLDATNAAVTVLQDSGQGPFDGADDTLVGVLNQSSSPIDLINLSSTTQNIFGFDGDEICSGDYGTWSPALVTSAVSGDTGSAGCPYGGDATTAAGPDTSFSNISSDQLSGTVTFPQALAPGESTYFSLEAALTAGQIQANDQVSASMISGTASDYSHPFSQSTVPLYSAGTPSGPVITVNQQNRSQTIDGFGASLTGSAARGLLSLTNSKLRTVMASLFSPTSGAGISLIRISIGASDFSPGNFTEDDNGGRPDPTLAAFKQLLPMDRATISLLKIAKKDNPKLEIIATPWTAPPWMKTNYGVKGVNAYSAQGGGTLNVHKYSKIFSIYATYLTKFVSLYKQSGVSINYVTPQNEPESHTTGSVPGMDLSSGSELKVIQSLGPDLAKASPTTKILAYDWNWSSARSWGLSGILKMPSVVGTAWHCYGGGSATVQSSFADYQSKPSKLDFITECTGHGPDGPIGSTNNFANNLKWDSENLVIAGLNNFASGVELWNLALPSYGYVPPSGGCPSNKATNQYCRGVMTVNSPTSIHDNVEYYILKALANSIESGSRLVAVSKNVSASSLKVTAALNPDGTTGLYICNVSSSSVPSFTVVDGGEQFSYGPLPPNSVASFEWTN